MNISRAMNIYYGNNPQAMSQVKRIMKWNEKGTLKDNYTTLNINPGHALNLSRMYKLAYKKNTSKYYIKKGE